MSLKKKLFLQNLNNQRDLPYLVPVYALPNKNNTIENCQQICAQNNYEPAGLQFS